MSGNRRAAGPANTKQPTKPAKRPRTRKQKVWRVAKWFRGHAAALQVKYVIWQGRFWSPQVRDQGGWGTRYSGGGIYDVRNATGGHYDHVHVSFRE